MAAKTPAQAAPAKTNARPHTVESHGRPPASRGKVRRMEIEPNDDGTFQSRTYFHPPATGGNKMSLYDMDMKPSTAGHATSDDLAQHIQSTFGNKKPTKVAAQKQPAAGDQDDMNGA